MTACKATKKQLTYDHSNPALIFYLLLCKPKLDFVVLTFDGLIFFTKFLKELQVDNSLGFIPVCDWGIGVTTNDAPLQLGEFPRCSRKMGVLRGIIQVRRASIAEL
jgi:hypothetical protein